MHRGILFRCRFRLFSQVRNQPASRINQRVLKAIALAAAQGQKIYTLNQANQTYHSTILSQITIDADAKVEIQYALDAGLEATVHQSPITVSGWTGSGYILLDKDTGAGAYKISGGANGASFAKGIASVMSIILFFAKASNPIMLLWTILTVVIAVTAAIIDAHIILDTGGKCSVALADFSLKISVAFALAGLFVSSRTVQGLALRLLTIMYGGELFKGVAAAKGCL